MVVGGGQAARCGTKEGGARRAAAASAPSDRPTCTARGGRCRGVRVGVYARLWRLRMPGGSEGAAKQHGTAPSVPPRPPPLFAPYLNGYHIAKLQLRDATRRRENRMAGRTRALGVATAATAAAVMVAAAASAGGVVGLYPRPPVYARPHQPL